MFTVLSHEESLTSDGEQFHQYQQNEQPPLTSNNTTTYGVRNQGPRLGQTQKYNRAKSVNETRITTISRFFTQPHVASNHHPPSLLTLYVTALYSYIFFASSQLCTTIN
jgi:hypothetical protein